MNETIAFNLTEGIRYSSFYCNHSQVASQYLIIGIIVGLGIGILFGIFVYVTKIIKKEIEEENGRKD